MYTENTVHLISKPQIMDYARLSYQMRNGGSRFVDFPHAARVHLPHQPVCACVGVVSSGESHSTNVSQPLLTRTGQPHLPAILGKAQKTSCPSQPAVKRSEHNSIPAAHNIKPRLHLYDCQRKLTSIHSCVSCAASDVSCALWSEKVGAVLCSRSAIANQWGSC